MAKATFNFPISSNLGTFSVYKMKGVDKLIFRSKGGPSKKQVSTGSQYLFYRQNMSEFGGAAKAASHIYNCGYGIKHLADPQSFGALTKLCKIIQKKDGEVSGKRGISFSRYGNLFTGFSFNHENSFDTIVRQSPTVTFSRGELKAAVKFSDLLPGINLVSSWQLPHYRFILSFGIAPDMVFTTRGYMPVNPKMRFNPNQLKTEWLSISNEMPAITHEISLPEPTVLDDSGVLVVSVGIEFGRMASDNVIEPVRFCGSAKILGVG